MSLSTYLWHGLSRRSNCTVSHRLLLIPHVEDHVGGRGQQGVAGYSDGDWSAPVGHTGTESLTHTVTESHTHSHRVTHSHSHTHTLTHTHTHSLTHSLTHSFTLTQSHTHTHTHTHLAISLTYGCSWSGSYALAKDQLT